MIRRIVVALIALLSLTASAGPMLRRPLPSGYIGIDASFGFPADETALERLRSHGDLGGQRRQVWQVFDGLTRSARPGTPPAFMTWFSAAETFSTERREAVAADAPHTLASAFAQTHPARQAAAESSLPPLIVRTHYNADAYQHIRDHGLHRKAVLDALLARQGATISFGVKSIPSFPRAAIVVKTAWWPVPDRGVAALPVWDEAANPPNSAGNDYPTWKRLVGVCGLQASAGQRRAVAIEFLGRLQQSVRCVDIERFHHVVLDRSLAGLLMTDPGARRLAAIVLGRRLRAGDGLVLVAMHLATREMADWVWGTFWWHDAPGDGAYAADRPPQLPSPWRNYLMSVAFDADLPRQPDSSSHVAYNPWFEARLPDEGFGGGVVSNCTSCHRRAAYPSHEPFTVTRGRTAHNAQPHGPSQVETSALWSIPLEAQ